MGFNLVIYKPGLFSLGKYKTKCIINLLWYIITLGRVRILLLLENNLVVHSIYITSKTYRFAYMNKKDINIGQAETLPDYRGRGIFTNLMKLILEYFSNTDISVWVYCDINNIASQKAIERAGFEFVSDAKISKLTRIVHVLEKK